jgi:hypothetical protein
MKLKLLIAALPLTVSGCASALPDVVVISGHPDSVSDIHPGVFRSPLGIYTHRTPVDPKPWRQQNDAQSKKGGE